MTHVDAETVHTALDWEPLIQRLTEAFAADVEAPPRQHHTIPRPDAPDGTWLLMPAWMPGRYAGLKSVTVYEQRDRDVPSVQGLYVLMDAQTGTPVRTMDATALTLRRTAAASALAARHLARPDAATLLMIGAGALAPYLIAAHRHVRPITQVLVWNRTATRAEALAERVGADGLPCRVVDSLADAAPEADVISCATMSTEPLVRGAWLTPGTHLDLVGAYTPTMRETDDDAIARAEVFVDTMEGAFAEAGDILQPLRAGRIDRDHVRGDLRALCTGQHVGRSRPEAVTAFKSVGTALEDLAAAMLVAEVIE